LLIVRNGYVVLDAHFYPFQDGQIHDVASMTKSITSTLIGIAIGEHKLSGVGQRVIPLFPEEHVVNHDQRKDRITIEHLLTMTSGLDCLFDHGEITLKEMMQSPDWIKFMLDLPMAAEPGSKFEYCSGGYARAVRDHFPGSGEQCARICASFFSLWEFRTPSGLPIPRE
jgi:CubicO group peptidase (beta-lactamase class C family)